MSNSELLACPEKPTHVCVVCAARWINNPDGSWSLATAECGPCCDNVPMDKAPIVKLLPEGYPDGQEYKRVRGAYDQAQRDALVARYGGIICTLCGEPFEQHYRNWRCSKRIAPRFTFPAESTDRTQLDELRAERRMLLDLLAIIHRDGGQYVDTHGLEKAGQHAITLTADLRAALERIAQPVFVAEPAGKPDSAWLVALDERIKIARKALGGTSHE